MSLPNTLSDILNDKATITEESSEYHAFRKIKNTAPALRIIFTNGNQQILPFSTILAMDYNLGKDAIAITSAGESLIIAGKNLAPCMDLLTMRNIAYLKEAPQNYQPQHETETIIRKMVWVKLDDN